MVLSTTAPQRSELIYQLWLSAGDPCLALDRDLRLVAGNEAAGVMLPQALEILSGRTLWEALPGYFSGDLEAVCRAAIQTQMGMTVEQFVPTTKQWYSVRVSPGKAGVMLRFEDVSEKKDLEHTQDIVNQRFEAVVQGMTEGMIVADPAGNVLTMNRAALEMYQFVSSEEARRNLRAYRGVFLLHDLEDQLIPVERWPLARAIAGESFSDSRCRVIRTDTGKVWYASFNGSQVHDEAGKPLYAVLTVRDITSQHLRDTALRDSEEFNRRLIDSSVDSIKVLDLNGRLLKMSRGGQNLLEITDSTPYLGKHWTTFWRPEDRAMAEAALAAAKAGEVGRFQAPRLTARGRLTWWDVQVTPIGDAQGRPKQLLAISRDITEQRLAGEALHASEARLREALRAGRMMAFEWDVATDAVVRSSHAVELLQMAGAETGTASAFFDLVHPEDRPGMQEAIVAAASQGGHYEAQYRLRLPSGSTIWLWDTGQVEYDAAGKPVRLRGLTADITERKHDAEALRASEERRELAIRATQDGIWDWDPQTQAYVWSDRLTGMLGYEPGEIPATVESFNALLHPDDVAVVWTTVQGYLQRQTPSYEVEFRLRHKDGSYRWILSRGMALFDAQGKPRRMVGAHTDITDRKRAEASLRESEERFRRLVEASSAMVWTTDPNGVPREDSPSWRAFTGYSVEQWIGSWQWLQAMHPEDRQHVGEVWQRALESTSHYEVECRIRHHSGEYRHLACRAVPLLNADGSVRLWVGMNTDITDQRRREQEIERLNRTLKALSASSQRMGRAQQEREYLQEVCQIIVEDCSHAMVWVGYAQSDEAQSVRPVAWSGFDEGYLETLSITWADREHGRGPTGTAIRTGTLQMCRNILTDPRLEPWRDEATRRGYRSSIALPLLRGDKAFGALTIYSREPDPFTEDEVRLLEELAADLAYGVESIRMRDARDRAEAELRRAKEIAEEANQAKDRFLATLSHELRTPLTPVATTVQMLEADKTIPPELRDQIAMIGRNVELETRLIDDLLDMTRIARGKISLNLSQVDLHQLIRQAAQIVDADIRSRGQLLTLDLTAERSTVRGDAARLQQVLWNLLKNSTKFTPIGGQICVYTRDLPEGRLEICVSDTGVGIAPEVLPHIFNAFEQGSQEITKQFGGLGLGLAISKSLVDLHHGTIQAHSEGKDKGCTFTLTLPVVAGANWTSAPANGSVPDSAHKPAIAMRVLLVEDHHDTARVMRRVLAGMHCEVRHADSVAAALRVFEAEPFDLIVSDLGLPDGSGHDLMRQLRQKRAVPGIALSGYGMEDDLRKSREAGFQEHLTKPVNVQALRDAIGRVGHFRRPV